MWPQTGAWLAAALSEGRRRRAGGAASGDEDPSEWSPLGTGDFMFDADALLATRSCPKYAQAVSSSSSCSYTVSHALAHCRHLATLDGCVKALRWVAAYYTVAASAKAASLRKAGATKFHVTTHTQVKG